MSSYVEGPFEIEERRLRGIVYECQENLNRVMSQLDQVRQVQAAGALAREKSENEQYEKQMRADNEVRVQIKERERKERQRREEVRQILEKISVDLQLQKTHLAGMEHSIQRQKKLEAMLESGIVRLDQIEEQIEIHRFQIMQEMKKAIRGQNNITVVYEEGEAPRKGKKVSLQIETSQSRKNTIISPSPKDTFEKKIMMTMESPYADRFPSIHKMWKDYKSQPDGMKNAFVVRNTETLDEWIRKLNSIQSMDSGTSARREQTIKHYRALCQLLHEEVNIEMIQDSKAMRALEHKCNQMFDKYKQIQKQKYFSESIAAVMEKHGIIFQDSEDHVTGNVMHFLMDHAVLDISGGGQDQVVMEVVGQYKGERPTMNDRRKSSESAGHLCSMMTDIEDELREKYGIVFGHLIRENPKAENMRMRRQNGSQQKKYYSAGHANADSFL